MTPVSFGEKRICCAGSSIPVVDAFAVFAEKSAVSVLFALPLGEQRRWVPGAHPVHQISGGQGLIFWNLELEPLRQRIFI